MKKNNVLVDPSTLGFNRDSLNRVQIRVEGDIANKKYDGARIMVARKGQLVLDLTLGYAERETQRPMQEDAIFSIMSVSKALTATALLRCVQRGDVSLLTKVAEIIPEFAKRGKEGVTVGHIITHTAGLGMAPAPIPIPDLGVLEKSVAAICDLPLETPPRRNSELQRNDGLYHFG
jgi:CubicO group peptidase (beta-lactamase class C family)